MKTFHLKVSTKRGFEKIKNGTLLVFPVSDDVYKFTRGHHFEKLKIWHGPEVRQVCITRAWCGTTKCEAGMGIIVNMVKCDNCIDWAKCSSSSSSKIVIRKEKAVSCVRMSQFFPMLNQT